MPSQQTTTRPAPMEGVKRTNAVIRGPEQEIGAPLRRDSYTMEVDKGRNYYVCGGFGHMACHCKNREKVVEERRLEFEGNYEHSNSLKEKENLESLD